MKSSIQFDVHIFQMGGKKPTTIVNVSLFFLSSVVCQSLEIGKSCVHIELFAPIREVGPSASAKYVERHGGMGSWEKMAPPNSFGLRL